MFYTVHFVKNLYTMLIDMTFIVDNINVALGCVYNSFRVNRFSKGKGLLKNKLGHF